MVCCQGKVRRSVCVVGRDCHQKGGGRDVFNEGFGVVGRDQFETECQSLTKQRNLVTQRGDGGGEMGVEMVDVQRGEI